MADLDWSDLRTALAVAEAGSLAAGARALGVNHSTVLRRLAALEAQLGTRVFERQRSGVTPTDAGRVLVEQARRMADRAAEIERQVLGRDRELSGTLRVTTAFAVMGHLLPQPLADFARAYPGIEVEVVENAFLSDLSRLRADAGTGAGAPATHREADVALRLSPQVAEHLVGRPLGLAPCRVYARRGAPGLPQTEQPLPVLLRDCPWVAFERDASHRVYDRWLQRHLPPGQVRVRVDIFDAVAAMLHTGIGVGVLPAFMQPRHPDLLPVSAPIPELTVPVWMLTHPDLRGTARVRAFMRHVGDAIAARLARDDGAEPVDPAPA